MPANEKPKQSPEDAKRAEVLDASRKAQDVLRAAAEGQMVQLAVRKVQEENPAEIPPNINVKNLKELVIKHFRLVVQACPQCRERLKTEGRNLFKNADEFRSMITANKSAGELAELGMLSQEYLRYLAGRFTTEGKSGLPFETWKRFGRGKRKKQKTQ